MIAKHMNLTEKETVGTYLASIIHDVGRTYIPIEIVNKPGRLTHTEFSIVKMHPRVGYDILGMVEFSWPIAEIILQHHEGMDGSGYPEGLSGKDILIEARVLEVGDVAEAMSSQRPYRQAHDQDEIIEELFQNREVLYNPQVADVCLQLFAEEQIKFQENSSNEMVNSARDHRMHSTSYDPYILP